MNHVTIIYVTIMYLFLTGFDHQREWLSIIKIFIQKCLSIMKSSMLLFCYYNQIYNVKKKRICCFIVRIIIVVAVISFQFHPLYSAVCLFVFNFVYGFTFNIPLSSSTTAYINTYYGWYESVRNFVQTPSTCFFFNCRRRSNRINSSNLS